MSVKVELDELAAAMADFDVAYVVTVSADARVHVLSVWPEASGDGIVVDGVGRHTQANATVHPDVTLVFPPPQAGGHTLLVDGTATVEGSTLTIAPRTAILHRPAAGPDGRRAGSECQDVAVTQ